MSMPVTGARGAAIWALLLCATGVGACVRPSIFRQSPSATVAQTGSSTPRRVSVVSADVTPNIPTAGWQPNTNQSVLAGALAGGGAGAGVGAGVCTPSVLCPPCYAACVTTLGLGGALVGAFGGHIAHRELGSDPANRMLPAPDALPARFRARVMAALSAQPGIVAEDGGEAALPFARDEPDRGHDSDTTPLAVGGADSLSPDLVLEIALTDIHAEALRKGGFEVAMKARARVRDPSTGKRGDVENFEYNGKRIAEGGGIEAEAARIDSDVEHGLDEMAQDIRAKLLEND